MASPVSPSRSYCATCGWPLMGMPFCEGCGGDAIPLPLQDGGGRLTPRDPEVASHPGVEKATEAWRQGDHTRALSHLIGVLGLSSRSVSGQEGPSWILVQRRTAIFLQLRTSQVVVESPLCKLPQRQRVAALRFALEVCARELYTSRVCLRGDLLVLRFVGRIGSLTPALLLLAIREAFTLAERYADELTSTFDARPAIAEAELGQVGWEAIGTPRALTHLGAPASVRSDPPPSSRNVTPMPRSASRGGAPPRGEAPAKIPSLYPPAEGVARFDDLPPVLAPSLAAGGASLGTPPLPQFSKRRPTLNEIQVDAPSKRVSMPPPPTGEGAGSDPDRLCELLRYAQALATALSFQERPATMMLLVRATVYRSLYDFGESVPDAVANLYRATAASTKEIWQTQVEGRRRSSMSIPIPLAEPALLVMERIVSSRAVVAKEKPATIEPLTSAAQAKEHLSRYMEEIERAPQEPPLLHFLAIGALAELLVRTKLPPQTRDRLRDIVSHAQREGSKPATIELMITALKRITAG